MTEIDGHKALKCRLDEVRDNGNVTTKGVRFRVEFTRASTSQAYSTLVTLTQEKGAESLFRGKFDIIRYETDINAPRTFHSLLL